MFKVSHQPIAALGGNDFFPDAWAWGVFDGMVCVARFGNQDAAEAYADWQTALSRGLPPLVMENQRLVHKLAEALDRAIAAEHALQAFVEGKLIVKP